MQDSMNNPQAKPEIYLERSEAKDGPSQAGNMWSAPPWISTVRAGAKAGAGAEPGEGVPRQNPGGPNRGWDSAPQRTV